MLRSALLVSLSFAAALSAQSNPFRAAAIFGDHMVLPAETSAPIHGFGAPGAEVVASPSWGAAVRAKVGADGRWQLCLATPARGDAAGTRGEGSRRWGLAADARAGRGFEPRGAAYEKLNSRKSRPG